MSTCEIINKYGHYEIYINGKFYCSADDTREVEDALDEYYTEKGTEL